jgi:hypothetical protein
MSQPTPRLAHVLRPYRAGLLVLLPLAMFEVGLDGAMTLSYKFLIDYAIVPQNKQALLAILGILAGIVILASVTAFWRDYHYANVAAKILADIRTRGVRTQPEPVHRLLRGARRQRHPGIVFFGPRGHRDLDYRRSQCLAVAGAERGNGRRFAVLPA